MMNGGLSPASGESMLTGSPLAASYGNQTNLATPSSPFLPPYLLGRQSTPADGHQKNYQSHTGAFNASSMLSPGGHHHVTWSPDLIQRIPGSATSATNVNRFGGPPTRGLELTSGVERSESTNIVQLDSLDSSKLVGSPTNLTASQVDPFYTQGNDFDPTADLDDAWVTVFGFSADSANYILKEFSTYGTIVQHEFASKGNWVHIRYQSPMQARKALSKNGHFYAQNTIRIGVSPCIDKDIMRRFRRKNVLTTAEPDDGVGTKRLRTSISTSRIPNKSDKGPPVSSLLFTRVDTSTPVRASPLSAIPRFDNSNQIDSPISDANRSARLGSMRSLAAAYDNGRPNQLLDRSEHGAAANGADGNVLTKAWKYIFSL